MNPFHLALALGPVSVYLLALSGIHFGRHPVMISGARDTLALAMACTGFVLVGPLQLFVPEGGAVAMLLGPWIWAPLLSLYGLCCLLAALLLRPRLVIYNVTVEQLRPLLEEAARELDADRRWAGSSLLLPGQGVQLTVEAWPSMKNVQLVSAGPDQDLVGWKRLERRLRAELLRVPTGPSPRATSYLFFALMLATIIGLTAIQQPQELAAGIDMLLDR